MKQRYSRRCSAWSFFFFFRAISGIQPPLQRLEFKKIKNRQFGFLFRASPLAPSSEKRQQAVEHSTAAGSSSSSSSSSAAPGTRSVAISQKKKSAPLLPSNGTSTRY